jgi:hypothetical protein
MQLILVIYSYLISPWNIGHFSSDPSEPLYPLTILTPSLPSLHLSGFWYSTLYLWDYLWQHIVSGCIWRSFWKRLECESVDSIKKFLPYQCGCTSSNLLRVQREQKDRGKVRCSLLELGCPSLLALGCCCPVFPGFRLELDLALDLRPSDADFKTLNFCSPFYVPFCKLLALFPWKTLANALVVIRVQTLWQSLLSSY